MSNQGNLVMFLSDRDLLWAIDNNKLISKPYPNKDDIGSSSIDLHLDRVEEAKIWNINEYNHDAAREGNPEFELELGEFDYRKVSQKYLITPSSNPQEKVFRRRDQLIIKPNAFVLWQTKEKIGTPSVGADLICFIDGKSTKARAGVMVHITAPTIHSSWAGKVTLEIVNLGPFHIVLKEDDKIAQITVSKISSVPKKNMLQNQSQTLGQGSVSGNQYCRSPC